jgi:hypothetical protein
VRRGPRLDSAPLSSLLGENQMRTHGPHLTAALLLAVASTARADVVTDWNVTTIQTLAAEKAPPTLGSRNIAIVHAAMFDAVNAVTREHMPYRAKLQPAAGASPVAAAAAAAHATLLRLYPTRKDTLDAALEASLKPLPDDAARRDGVALGERAAGALLALRANDGALQTLAYSARSGAGAWTVSNGVAPLAPHWGSVAPFALQSGAQFRAPPPPTPDSAQHLRDYDEVYRIGGKASTVRTQEQTDIARLWITLGVPTWNPIARQLSAAKGMRVQHNARLFALLNIAGADALIACWDSKYAHHGWRPVDAIRAGGVPGRAADPAWESAIPTPPFPGYVSGHACFAGAAQTVLEAEFGSGTIPAVSLSTPTAPGVTRRYTRLNDIVAEISNARIWGGIHWRTDQDAGETLGRQVGQWVVSRELRPAQ